MIFLTVGSQKFPFNRLVRCVDEAVSILNDIDSFAQIGCSKYEPKYMKYTDYLDRSDFSNYMSRADIVITHGGTGAIISALKNNKKVIAVPRSESFGEHVDNHQYEIVSHFSETGLIEACFDPNEILDAILKVEEKAYRPYQGNSATFISDLESVIHKLGIGVFHG